MSWAERAKEMLQRGDKTVIYSKFDSIQDRINAGDAVHLRPVKKKLPKENDIVLVNIQGKDYFGEVDKIDKARYFVGNKAKNKLYWVPAANIFGIVTDIEKK